MKSETQARGAHACDALARFSTPLKHAIPGACFVKTQKTARQRPQENRLYVNVFNYFFPSEVLRPLIPRTSHPPDLFAHALSSTSAFSLRLMPLRLPVQGATS
jgi:hypothetical protein